MGGPPPLTARQAFWALVSALLTVGMSSLDMAMANTALPTIAASLQVAPAQSVWVINAYQLAMMASLLPFAALGDWLGPRRVCLGGLLGFVLASAACALSQDMTQLTLARAAQGLCNGALMSVNLALVKLVVPADRLGRGVGLNALVVGLGFTLGPTVTSAVLALASWHWLFAISIVLAIAALLLAWPALPRTPGGHGVDPVTALLTATTFGALMGAMATAAQRMAWPLPLGLALLALLAGALLLRRQAGHPAPMLPVDLLRLPMFSLSVLTSLAAFATQGLAFVGLPFYFQYSLGHDAVTTGLLMTPWAGVVALAAPVAGRLSDHHPPGLLGGVGMAILALGMAAIAALPTSAGPLAIGACMALCGAGFGLFQAPNLKALMSAAPAGRIGGASGMVAMARLTGQSLGAAAVALCFSLAGPAGPTWALLLGACTATLAAVASGARLRLP